MVSSPGASSFDRQSDEEREPRERRPEMASRQACARERRTRQMERADEAGGEAEQKRSPLASDARAAPALVKPPMNP